jgi:hypothetical protein
MFNQKSHPMKKYIIISLLMVFSIASVTFAQSKVDVSNPRYQSDKYLWKMAKKAVKTLQKEFKYMQRGPLTLEYQFFNYYKKYVPEPERYISIDRYVSAPTDNLAMTKAMTNIKQEVASIIGTYVEGVVRSSQTYNELSKNQRDQVDEIIGASRETFASAIGDAIVADVKAMKVRKHSTDDYALYVLCLMDKQRIISNSQDVVANLQNAIKKSADIDMMIDYRGEELNSKLDQKN